MGFTNCISGLGSVAACVLVGGVDGRYEFGGGPEVDGSVGDGECSGVDGVVGRAPVSIRFLTSGCKSTWSSVSTESSRLSIS